MKQPLRDVTTLLLVALVAAAFALSVPAASLAAETSARLLAQVEPRIKAIYEKDEFRMRFFRANPAGQLHLDVSSDDFGLPSGRTLQTMTES